MIELVTSLYFHIPFCKRKCDYCHFYVLPDQEAAKDQLLEGFLAELELFQTELKNQKVVTLYFGGGTPSLFGPSRITTLIDSVAKICTIDPSAEITLEANPENLSLDLMRAYAHAGINRVSIGVQSLDHQLLSLLGRLHQPETALQAVVMTHQAGIENISIDLMYDLPKQTLLHWSSTLDQIQKLPLTHLSLYNLTIEPHTLFFKKELQLRPLLPDQETSLAMYELAIQKLEQMGLKQYEISAFAIPGAESQHNTGYWIGRPFLGFGPSAFSYWQGKRFRNVAHLNRYCQQLKSGQSPVDFEEKLDEEAHRRELFVIQLRMLKGVSVNEFSLRHGSLDLGTIATLERLINEGYLFEQDGYTILTRKGVLFYDMIASELI